MHRHGLLLRVTCKRLLSTAASRAEAARNAATSSSTSAERHAAASTTSAAAPQTIHPSSLFDWKALQAEKQQ
jgi:hypothetical protein